MFFSKFKPEFDVPMESFTPKLILQGVEGLPYNIVSYGDVLWAVHWAEGEFDINRFFGGNAINPILMGEGIEEIKHGLKVLHMNLEHNGIADDYFHVEANNLLYIKDEYRKGLVKILPDSPACKNSALQTSNLFDRGDELPIIILSPAPSRACNYRCEYCFNHDHSFSKNDLAMESWAKSILTAVKRIPRPLHMSIGAMGEPMAIKKWLDTIAKALDYDHVKRVSFVTNLGVNPAEVIPHLDFRRLGVLATLHPSEFKNYEKDLSIFIDRVLFLKNSGASVAVNYVLIPEQLDRFTSFSESMKSLDIQMISNVLRGPFRGKVYPEAYSDEEYAAAHSCHASSPFVWNYQSHEKSPYGMRCVSGRWGFQLEFDGTVYNCDFARQRLGSIYDETLMARTENCFCTADKCESQVMLGMIEDVAAEYKMDGNMHTFTKRSKRGFNPLA